MIKSKNYYCNKWGIPTLPFFLLTQSTCTKNMKLTDIHSHTHTDLLTSKVPVALLSEKQLELGDNLIDFILSLLGRGEAWRRHFNSTASPQSPNLPLLSARRHGCERAVKRPVAYWCFCMFYVFLEIWWPWHSADFHQLATYHKEWQLGKV